VVGEVGFGDLDGLELLFQNFVDPHVQVLLLYRVHFQHRVVPLVYLLRQLDNIQLAPLRLLHYLYHVPDKLFQEAVGLRTQAEGLVDE
jgi:hypothetical protein